MDLIPERTALNSSSLTTKSNSLQIPKFRNTFKDFILWNSFFVVLLIFVGPICLHLTYRLPTVKSGNVSINEFSEERALNYLNQLTSIGSRVTPTYENLQAKKYILSQIDRICSANQRNLRCEIHIQRFHDVYSNELENILVRISNLTTNPSNFLLTAHYDTVEFSSGASDDGSGVVILLELLTNILNDNLISFSKMNLILLFTNGEELGPEGVLAFLNEHSWSLNLTRFIYIDSINCREKSSLIQLKSSQLLIDYSSVSRPSANLLFEYIPHLIGITSDYDIYSSNSSFSGYNFGHFLDGYNYHSLLDNTQTIKQGVLQELGDTLHELIQKIFSQEINQNKNEQMIYFDLFGRYLIYYRLSTSNLIQIILIILILIINLSLIIIDHRFNHEICQNYFCLYKYFDNVFLLRLLTILFYFVSHFISLLLSLIISLIFSWFLSHIRPLSFYGNSTLTLFLFTFPCLFLFLLIYYLLNKFHRKFIIQRWSIKSSIDSKYLDKITFNYEQNLSILLIYSLLMLISILSNSRLFYIILIWSIFICPINLCAIIVDFLIDWNLLKISTRNFWFYIPFLSALFPLIHTIEIIVRLLRVFIPFICRGFSLNKFLSENQIICGLISIPNLLLILILIPLIHRSKQILRTLTVLSIGLLLLFFIIFIREPYTNEHPKLFYAKHTSKSIYTVLKHSNKSYQIPIVSQASLITMMTFDNLPLEPALDEFSMKIGFELNNLKCSTRNKCIFNDSFNRTLAIENIQIQNQNHSQHLIIQLKHVSTFNIHISSRSDIEISIENSEILPRNLTIIHLKFHLNLNLFDLNIDIKRCHLNDSPFLVLFNRLMPHMLLTGDSYCHSITDLTTILFDTKYII